MTDLRAAGIEVVLLDIEGTTTPIAFVHDVLFPYARGRYAAWLASRSPSDPRRREVLQKLREESGSERLTPDEAAATLIAYTDQDRKSPALKLIQGYIWQDGYADGTLHSEVYPDVPPAFARWRDEGVAIGIYSSGSVLAQKLLFAHTNAGDLTSSLRWHFDTAVGAKGDTQSYRRIAEALGIGPSAVLFVSDVIKELDAAGEAGMRTLLCVRAPATPPSSAHAIIRTFDDIERVIPASFSARSC